MSGTSRKELTAQYKERKVVGGVYAVRNTINNRLLLGSTADLQAAMNRFDFAVKTGSCVDPKLQKDWSAQNGEGFTFEVIEEIEKNEAQTDAQFRADIGLLREMQIEKLDSELLY